MTRHRGPNDWMHRKILLIIIDGLRPDAITPQTMPNLSALAREGWQAEQATTVRPSATVPALTSLATGVSPTRHGWLKPGMEGLFRLGGLRLLPVELRRMGVDTTVIVSPLTAWARWIARALLRLGGVTRLMAPGRAPRAIVGAAVARVTRGAARELVVAYLNDADQAGHAGGWMSAGYLNAAGAIDRALEPVRALVQAPDVLIIVCADHGGGGVLPDDHDDPHPLNDGIPILLLGGRVDPGQATAGAGLLDIPPTILHGFGVSAPGEFEGVALHIFAPGPLDTLFRDPFSEFLPSTR